MPRPGQVLRGLTSCSITLTLRDHNDIASKLRFFINPGPGATGAAVSNQLPVQQLNGDPALQATAPAYSTPVQGMHCKTSVKVPYLPGINKVLTRNVMTTQNCR